MEFSFKPKSKTCRKQQTTSIEFQLDSLLAFTPQYVPDSANIMNDCKAKIRSVDLWARWVAVVCPVSRGYSVCPSNRVFRQAHLLVVPLLALGLIFSASAPPLPTTEARVANSLPIEPSSILLFRSSKSNLERQGHAPKRKKTKVHSCNANCPCDCNWLHRFALPCAASSKWN